MRKHTIFQSLGIVALLMAGASGAVQAADMPGFPPPLMAPPAPQPQFDGGNGFYLRGDVGMGMYEYSSMNLVSTQGGLTLMTNSLKDSVFAGVGAGYAFNSWLRADATVEYRLPSAFKVMTASQWVGDGSCCGGYEGQQYNGSNVTKGRLSAIVGLVNGYVDLGTWNRITPYVGAGVGAAYVKTTDTYDYAYGDNTGGGPQGLESGKAPDKTKTQFAWALHAGVSYDLSPNWKADVGYRYLNIGSVNSGTVKCYSPCSPGYNVGIKSLDSQDIRVGMRYVFADNSPSYAAPVPYPAPIIRKY